ncbi:MAG: YceI family protein [Chloroflexi bacterium]|nr:YceI family protein [Chloroflexota bacterium]
MKKKSFGIVFSFITLLLLAACTAAEESASTATAVPPTNEPAQVEEEAVADAEVESNEEATDSSLRIFTIVPEESQALYRVEEEFLQGAVENLGQTLGFFEAVGTTNIVAGEFQLLIDGTSVTVEGGEFTVDLSTLTSNESRRDKRIRERHLESDTFPIATFVISGVEDFPAEYSDGQEITFKLIGAMTIREITNEEVLTTTAVLQNGVIRGNAFTEIMMVDYGFDPPVINGFLEALDPAGVEVIFTAKE